MTRFTISVCGGALAALLFYTARLEPSAGSSASTLPDRAGAPTATGSMPEKAGSLAADESPAAADGLPVSDWAFLDPAGFFDHAEGADSIDRLIAGLEVLIATDPARVFAIVSRFAAGGSADVDALYFRAIQGMAGRDPQGTIARLQGVANGPRRDPILAAIAAGYAKVDPVAALQWAVSVVPPSPDGVDSVIATVASSDLLRAYDLMQQVPGSIVDAARLGAAMARTAMASGQAPASLASALAARGGPDANSILSVLMQTWAPLEPENAVDWMTANEVYLTDELTRATVYNLAFEDVTAAAALTSRVPASARRQWLAEVANRYGQFDIEAALRWLPQYASWSGYSEILNRTLLGAVMPPGASPLVVADFIATSTADLDRDTVMRTGYSFADWDRAAATEWALGLTDPERAGWAAAAVADRWAQSDGPAAQRWALEQPRGAVRDQILGVLLTDGVFNDNLDRRALVQAFTSPAAAQESIYMFILRDVVNRRDVTAESQAQIEWMLERLTDPELRQEIEQRMAEAR